MSAFLSMYAMLHAEGRLNEARGQKTKEITDARLVFQPRERLSSYRARGLNLTYCKQELLWYLRADRYDHSIQAHAKMWKKLVAEDGGYHSNYGQYLFLPTTPDGLSPFDWCVKQLAADPATRRASIPLFNVSHLYDANQDVVCTYAINFRIRNARLEMTVHMRSNDAIFGTTNDVFCFSCVHELMYALLKSTFPDLRMGRYVHCVDSLHVYSRHFEMLEQLVSEGEEGYYDVHVPKIEAAEAVFLTRGRGLQLHREYAFTNWLLTEGD